MARKVLLKIWFDIWTLCLDLQDTQLDALENIFTKNHCRLEVYVIHSNFSLPVNSLQKDIPPVWTIHETYLKRSFYHHDVKLPAMKSKKKNTQKLAPFLHPPPSFSQQKKRDD